MHLVIIEFEPKYTLGFIIAHFKKIFPKGTVQIVTNAIRHQFLKTLVHTPVSWILLNQYQDNSAYTWHNLLVNPHWWPEIKSDTFFLSDTDSLILPVMENQDWSTHDLVGPTPIPGYWGGVTWRNKHFILQALKEYTDQDKIILQKWGELEFFHHMHQKINKTSSKHDKFTLINPKQSQGFGFYSISRWSNLKENKYILTQVILQFPWIFMFDSLQTKAIHPSVTPLITRKVPLRQNIRHLKNQIRQKLVTPKVTTRPLYQKVISTPQNVSSLDPIVKSTLTQSPNKKVHGSRNQVSQLKNNMQNVIRLRSRVKK